jgi:hypothetical protein
MLKGVVFVNRELRRSEITGFAGVMVDYLQLAHDGIIEGTS